MQRETESFIILPKSNSIRIYEAKINKSMKSVNAVWDMCFAFIDGNAAISLRKRTITCMHIWFG